MPATGKSDVRSLMEDEYQDKEREEEDQETLPQANQNLPSRKRAISIRVSSKDIVRLRKYYLLEHFFNTRRCASSVEHSYAAKSDELMCIPPFLVNLCT